jgi:hypothetical protein
MGSLYFLAITPMGFLMRACGKRPLELKFRCTAPSYWIERSKSTRQPNSMGKQY